MKTPSTRYSFVLPAALLGCFFTVAAFAQAPPAVGLVPHVHWETDINAALASAEKEQRPIFLHFIGNDCPPALQMENEVFVQPNIISLLNSNFVMVKINVSENAALTQKFSVTVIPTDLIIRPNGQIVHRRTGGITAERFADFLAYLLKTIQQPAAGQTETVPIASAVPGVTPTVQPVATVPQQQPIAVPEAVRDPFMQQTPPAAAMPIVARTTPATADQSPLDQSPLDQSPLNQSQINQSSSNPLRTIESVTEPTPAMEQASAPVQAPVNVTVPPPAATITPVMPTIMAINEPAPPKTMVEVPLALEGFCPVTLCTEERWISGNPAYCTMYQGHLFRFATAEALVTFAQNPAKYVPAAMGEDIVLMADRNKRVNGDRKFGAWFQERVFLFSNQETLNAFAARPEYYREIALKYELARKEQPSPIVY